MENTNALKTALGVGVLGTAAVALGYYYFNEDESEVENNSFNSEVSTEPTETVDSNITNDVIDEIALTKSKMQNFWAETYKSITSDSTNESTKENNEIISS